MHHRSGIEISVRARSYYIERIEQETDEALATRAWFVINQNPSTNNEFQEAVLLSRYWYYIKNYDCRYPQEMMERVKEAEKLHHV